MAVSENKAVVRRFFDEAINQQNLDALDQIIGLDLLVRPDEPPGPDAVKSLIRRLHAAFTRLHYVIDDLIAEDDKVVARTHASGTHNGEYGGFRGTGKVVRYRELFIVRIGDERIAEWWVEPNRLSILEQIGVIFTLAVNDELK